MLKKKIMSGGIACAMAFNSLLMIPLNITAADSEKFEFESGTVTGSSAAIRTGSDATVSGYSGDGYVYIQDAGDTASVTFTVSADDQYNLMIGYAAPFGSKQQDILVDGTTVTSTPDFSSESFAEYNAGIIKLTEGEHTLTVKSTWGWMYLDYVYVTPAEPIELVRFNTLSDPNATSEAQGLMNYMATVYGEYIISGQQEVYGGGRSGDYEWEFEYINGLSGEYPAIRGFDFMNYNSLYGWDDNTTERVIDWVNNRGGIATASWHINVPKDMSTYTFGNTLDWSACTYGIQTDFDPSKILTDETSTEYLYFMDAIDRLANELLEIQETGAPLIFRPFHEAEGSGGETGSWFWWGKDGSTVYKELWKLLYNKLTNEYGIHNLIWEFNSYTYGTSKNWYPGDEYVDLIGYDKYNGSVNNPNESAIYSTFASLVDMYDGGGKMVSLAECDTIPSIDNMLDEGAYWLYFCPWYESPDSDDGKFLTLYNNADTLTAIYQSESVITLGELPDYKTYEYTGEPFVPEPTEPTEPPTEYVPPEEGHATIIQETGHVVLNFPEAVGDTVYLVISLEDGITYANGGLGTTVEIDGNYYWVNIQWEATASGAVEVDMTNILNVTLDNEAVTDEAIIAQCAENVQELKSFQGQIWYTQDADGEAASTSNAAIVDAYLLSAAEQETTDPTEETTEQGGDPIVYGDVDCNGAVEIIDVITLSQALMGSASLTAEQIQCADVDLNGEVNSTDTLNIMKYLVKLISTLPV